LTLYRSFLLRRGWNKRNTPVASNVERLPLRTSTDDSSLPLGFRDIARRGIISATAISHLRTVHALSLDSAVNLQDGYEERLKILDRELEVLINPSLCDSGMAIEECCVLATRIYVNSVLRRGETIPHHLSANLKVALGRTDMDSHWGENYKVLLWVLFTGYSVKSGVYNRLWFSSYVREIAAQAEPEIERDNLKEILRGFLWCESLHDKVCEELLS
jgi:hypothetical protein